MSLPYEKWECFKAGLYKTNYETWKEDVERCADLLRSDELYHSMVYVSENWSNSAQHYFKQSKAAWQPWLGHSACCFEIGVPNWVTKKAWHLLSPEEQMRANCMAENVYFEWCEKNGVGDGQTVLV